MTRRSRIPILLLLALFGPAAATGCSSTQLLGAGLNIGLNVLHHQQTKPDPEAAELFGVTTIAGEYIPFDEPGRLSESAARGRVDSTDVEIALSEVRELWRDQRSTAAAGPPAGVEGEAGHATSFDEIRARGLLLVWDIVSVTHASDDPETAWVARARFIDINAESVVLRTDETLLSIPRDDVLQIEREHVDPTADGALLGARVGGAVGGGMAAAAFSPRTYDEGAVAVMVGLAGLVAGHHVGKAIDSGSVARYLVYRADGFEPRTLADEPR